jgi:type III pantothenate kinase
LSIRWLTATPSACGVVNRYSPAGSLGPDRWAALVAARLRALESDTPAQPVIVVNAGTAVTVDTLDADGVFRGGSILPSMRLMLRALADNTAALKVAPGGFADFPTNTADALYTGALQAVCGAIELARARVSTHGAPVRCYLAGGAAPEIGPHLAAPVDLVDNLVLEGVLALADGS